MATGAPPARHVQDDEKLTYFESGPNSTLTYHESNGNEEVIHGRNIIAVVPEPQGELPRRIIYVDEDAKEAQEGVPRIKFLTASTGLPQALISTYGWTASDKLDMETHVIVSTGSGTLLAERFFAEAVKPVLDSVPNHNAYQVHKTESAETVTELAESLFFPRASDGERLRIILLSGDGAVVDLVNAFLSHSSSFHFKVPEIIILPLGTGNALANSIGIATDNTYGLGTLVRGEPRPLPSFSVEFSPGARLLVDEARTEKELPSDPETGKHILYGAVVCSWGMHASLVGDSDTEEYRKHGVDRFKMAANEALFPANGSSPHSYRAKVSILKADGAWQKIDRDEHMYVLATLVSNLEKTFTISPASRPADGQLRLVHFGPMSGNEVMEVMGKAYQGGKHVEDPAVGYEDIEGLRIDFEGKEEDGRWRRICVDGKIVRVEKGGWVELRKEPRHVLNVICGTGT